MQFDANTERRLEEGNVNTKVPLNLDNKRIHHDLVCNCKGLPEGVLLKDILGEPDGPFPVYGFPPLRPAPASDPSGAP